jgi:hypothetical protein
MLGELRCGLTASNDFITSTALALGIPDITGDVGFITGVNTGGVTRVGVGATGVGARGTNGVGVGVNTGGVTGVVVAREALYLARYCEAANC